MEDEKGSDEASSSSKPIKKRTRSRRASQEHSVINLADASREVANASPCVTGKSSNCEINMPMYSNAQYCYSLLEAIPLPGPIWSTTAPSVLAISPSEPIEASVGFEWGENQASSYSWWLEFLESLDGNMTGKNLDYPFSENIVMENSKVVGHESPFVGAIDNSCCPDDWLIIPSLEKDFEEKVTPI